MISKQIENRVIEKCMKDVDPDKRSLYRAACYDVFKYLKHELNVADIQEIKDNG